MSIKEMFDWFSSRPWHLAIIVAGMAYCFSCVSSCAIDVTKYDAQRIEAYYKWRTSSDANYSK